MRITLHRIDDAFGMQATDEEGNKVGIDAAPAIGGKGNGVRPMQLLIMGLAGCAAIDVLQILYKQRLAIDKFSITVDADRFANATPALWEKAHIQFWATGNCSQQQLERAVQLSMEKYCSVAATLQQSGTQLSWESHLQTP